MEGNVTGTHWDYTTHEIELKTGKMANTKFDE